MTGKWSGRRALPVAAMALLCALAPAAASAHVRSSAGFSEIRQAGGEVRYRLSLEHGVLATAAGLEPDALDADAIGAYLTERVTVAVDGVQCESALDSIGLERREGKEYARALLAYDCPGSPAGSYEASSPTATPSSTTTRT